MNRYKELENSIKKYLNTPFDWETHNCGLAACSIASSYTDKDWAAPFLKHCSSPLSAMRMIKKRGGFRGIMKDLGLKPVSKNEASRGDAILYEWDHKGRTREGLGIVVDFRAAFAGPDGLTLIPITRCSQAWRVE